MSEQSHYGSEIAELLREPRLAPLGPGSPNLSVRSRLATLKPESLFAPEPVRDRDMAAACLAGLWLQHDFLDESHQISQCLDNTTGSYWHGLMHRREPDYENSKYWFRRVGRHPVFALLGAAASELAAGETHASAAFLSQTASWDPFAFIDLCEATASRRSPCEPLCLRVQQREWELLFDWCYRQAVGREP